MSINITQNHSTVDLVFLAMNPYVWADLGVAAAIGVSEIGRAHVELQSLMRISYAVFCLKKKINTARKPKLTIQMQYKKYKNNIDHAGQTNAYVRKKSKCTCRGYIK